ncbi:unnamed protein product [Effrenium voratum]|nr:unnamed protein product [Effrenium voratum]
MDALHGDGREKLVCAKKQMQDEDALQLQSLLGPSLSYREVDFSVNELTARGMGAVVDICKRSRRLQVLKLYRNRISDDCVEHFADLLRACPGLREVHLSHNLLSHEGVLQLAACVERRAEPLWLRVEQNTFTEPGDLLRQLEKDYSVCSPLRKRRDSIRRKLRNNSRIRTTTFDKIDRFGLSLRPTAGLLRSVSVLRGQSSARPISGPAQRGSKQNVEAEITKP